jgi:hypothetical protein
MFNIRIIPQTYIPLLQRTPALGCPATLSRCLWSEPRLWSPALRRLTLRAVLLLLLRMLRVMLVMSFVTLCW